MSERELIIEANKRGYRTGVLIDYEGMFPGTDTLGSGDFKLMDEKLIKYESTGSTRYDTVWSKESGWVKIAKRPSGFHV